MGWLTLGQGSLLTESAAGVQAESLRSSTLSRNTKER